MQVRKTWKDLFAFLKSPNDQRDSVQQISFKSKRLLSLLFVDSIIMATLMPILYVVTEKTGWIDLDNHRLNNLLQTPLPNVLFLVGVGGPLIEELLFRLYLRFEHNFLIQPIVLISAVAGKNTQLRVYKFLYNKWQAYYPVIFYLSAVIFAIVHVSNYEYSHRLLFLAPLLMAPQFIVGLFNGYLRVKYGLVWGFYLHALHNLIIVSALFVFNP